MKILFAGGMAEGNASRGRKLALERLGHEVVVIDNRANPYLIRNPLLHRMLYRLAMGPHAGRLNRDVLALAERERPDIFWAEKQLLLTPGTLKRLAALGIATVSYMIDNPFGPRKDPGWRRYLQCIPFYDLHVQQRDSSLGEYKARGAKDVMKVLIGYEPTLHFPRPEPLADAERDREVSFIGAAYDNRAETLTALSEAGVPLTISGKASVWKRVLPAAVYSKTYRAGELLGDAYREAIWRSKINLSFLTKSNLDEVTQKTFEIAGCGEFLMVERSPGHLARFKEDEEAVFFSDAEELLAKVRLYLPDEAARRRIAAAGRARAVRDGYDNDSQIRLILARLETARLAEVRA